MGFRFGLILCSAAILASCSPSKEDSAQGDNLGTFERKNVAPNPADSQLSQRKAEHAFARIALDCVNKQYPNKISHVMNSAADVGEPAKLTPVFYGCFDWHSSVHGHWLLTRLWGQDLVPEMDGEIVAALDGNFTEEKIAGELAYFNGEDRASFERPYGIAWFLQLTAELREIAKGKDAKNNSEIGNIGDRPGANKIGDKAGDKTGDKAEQAQVWLDRLKPLETKIVGNIQQWVPKLAYPIRIGTHNQSAFAFGLFLDWARESGDAGMEKLITDKTLTFHKDDKNCPLSYEPSGEDFLSPCLMEADLMRRVMSEAEFATWLTGFLPQIPTDGSGDWLATGIVNDPTDGKLVHLDGVNLSRAWALEGIASALSVDDPRRAALLASAKLHGEQGEASVSTPHYSGSHWLASFATYLRTKRGIADGVAGESPSPAPAPPATPKTPVNSGEE